MKIVAYGRMNEEIPFMQHARESLGIEIVEVEETLNEKNIELAKDADAVSVLSTSNVNRERLEIFAKYGVKYVGARCVGYNHIDVVAAKELGIRVCNAMYSSNCVADFTVMLMLMCIRKIPHIMRKCMSYNHTNKGNMGMEMPNLTIGIIGTGNIGSAVARRLRGFGCKILTYDIYQKEELKEFVEYVPLEELYKNSDMITFHSTLTDETFHMFGKEQLDMCKDGVILINAARGELIDTQVLLDGLASGKIGSAGLDSFEDEFGIIQDDAEALIYKRPDLLMLNSFPNVVLTPHIAFFTDQAVHDMVWNGMNNLLNFEKGGENRAEVRYN